MPDYAGKPSSFYATTGGKPVEGAWYSGQRYLGGQLLPAGQDQPGHTVSAEVNAQSSVAQGLQPNAIQTYLGNKPQTSPQNVTPTNADQVTPYLNNFQQDVFKSIQLPEIRTPTLDELKTSLTPTTPAPAPLDRVAEFQKMRTEYGVADLEASLNTIKDQVRAEQDAIRQARGIEEGKPVPMGVIAGRISEEERVANQRIDSLGREQSRITDQLNTKYGVINQFMTLKGLDYQDAVKAYDDEFSRNMKMYELVSSKQEFAINTALSVAKMQQSAYEFEKTTAKANLAIYANAATSGNLSYDKMSADQKLMISKLEVQSGFPVGFIGSLQVSPKDKILGFSEDKTQAWVIGNDGNVSVIQTGLRASGGKATDTKNIRQQFTEASTLSSGSNFPDLVQKFANTMTIEEIYQAYANSEKGKKYGPPVENPQEVKLLYKVARGEMTPDQARLELGQL